MMLSGSDTDEDDQWDSGEGKPKKWVPTCVWVGGWVDGCGWVGGCAHACIHVYVGVYVCMYVCMYVCI